MDKEHQQDMEIARRVMRDNQEALRELSEIPAESRPKIDQSPNGLPCFSPTGKVFTAEMVREAEAEMDLEEVHGLMHGGVKAGDPNAK